jgi:hypothetical protein
MWATGAVPLSTFPRTLLACPPVTLRRLKLPLDIDHGISADASLHLAMMIVENALSASAGRQAKVTSSDFSRALAGTAHLRRMGMAS